MPKTRVDETRDQKAAAILGVAERQLREGGYPALSVAAIGRELGVAQNTLYWYFRSKDELFVAALRRMLERIHARKPSRKAGKIEQILWFTDQFEELSGLRAAMTERARSSPVVAEFVQELDTLLSRMLSGALADDVPAAELPVAVEAFRATVEGTFVKELDRRERRRVLTFALQRLIEKEQPS
jgi:TetR/AcrR family transcriptional regulator, cholesterol catabolism regulator